MKPLYHHSHFIEEEIGPSPSPSPSPPLLAVGCGQLVLPAAKPGTYVEAELREENSPDTGPARALPLLGCISSPTGSGDWGVLAQAVLSQGPLRNAVGSSHPLGWVVLPSGTGMTARRQWPAAPGAMGRAVRQPRNAGRRKPARQHEPKIGRAHV